MLPVKALGFQTLYIQRVSGEGTGRYRTCRRCCRCEARRRRPEHGQVIKHKVP